MFLTTNALAPILYGLTSRYNVTRLIAVHGMEDPGAGLELADQYETAARIGLDRVHAEFALTIPFTFAYYGDLWEMYGHGTSSKGLGLLERFGPFLQMYPPDGGSSLAQSELEVDLALELLAHAGIPLAVQANYVLTHSTLSVMLAELERSAPGITAHGALWHFVNSIATYLTTPDLRDSLVERLASQIEAEPGDVVLVAHGLGSLICYDLLTRRPDLRVRCLVTLGSPLGLDSVRAALGEELDREDGATCLPFPSRLPRWINLYNGADGVASARLLSPLYRTVSERDTRHVEDIDTGRGKQPDSNNLFAGHHPAAYLSSKVSGTALRSVVER